MPGCCIQRWIISKGYVSLATTELYKDNYHLLDSLNGVNPPITTFGNAKGHFVIWPTNCLRLYQGAWVWSGLVDQYWFWDIYLYGVLYLSLLVVKFETWMTYYCINMILEPCNHVYVTALDRWLCYVLQYFTFQSSKSGVKVVTLKTILSNIPIINNSLPLTYDFVESTSFLICIVNQIFCSQKMALNKVIQTSLLVIHI